MKKGQGGVVAAVLLVLLVVSGAVIIVTIINPLLSGAGEDIAEGYRNIRGRLELSLSLSEGLIAHYEFDGNADDSQGNHDGTAYDINFIEIDNRAVAEFDGVTSYVMTENNGPAWLPVGDMAISTWVYLRSWGGGDVARIVASHDGQRFYFDGSGNTRIRFSSNDGGKKATSDENMVLGEWKHLVVNRIGTNIYFYIDGIESDSGDPNGGSPISGDYVLLGSDPGQDKVFDGYIDDIRIYDRSLSISEILELYNFPVEEPVEGIPINSCQILNEDGAIYVLQNDISGITEDCFIIEASNITLDFNGYSITGDAYYEAGGEDEDEFDSGVFNDGYMESYDNVTIRDGFIYDFGAGVKSRNGNNWMITNMTITNSEDFGDSDVHGIKLDSGNGNSIIGNDISNLYSDDETTYGIYISSGSNNIIEKNTVDNNFGGDDSYGIYLYSSSNNNIIDNIVTSNLYGIKIYSGEDNFLIDNIVNLNDEIGIELDLTEDNTLIGNTVSFTEDGHGIYLKSSSGNILIDNTASSSYDSSGIYLYLSSYNIIRDSTLNLNDWLGIGFNSGSENNEVYCGTFSGNGVDFGGLVGSNIYYGPAGPTGLDEANRMNYTCTVNSNLPIVIIDTYGSSIPDEPKIDGSFKIIWDESGGRNYIDDEVSYEGPMGIEQRGQSSQWGWWLKKSYGFETRDELNEDISVSLLGMPDEEDWILKGDYPDKTMIRNILAFELSKWMGMAYTPRSKSVELYFNNSGVLDYRGVYTFMEKIKRDAGRVDISKLEPGEISGEDLTGGYILRNDKTDAVDTIIYTNVNPIDGKQTRIIFSYPKTGNLAPEQEAYVLNYMNEFEAVLAGPNFTDPVNGYAKYIDVDSFIDYLILTELVKNIDGFGISTYFYKDKNGKLFMGPAWDYDLAFGNAYYSNGGNAGYLTSGWIYPTGGWSGAPIPFWWERFMEDPVFKQAYKDRWFELRQDALTTNKTLEFIDSKAEELDESQERNFNKWPIMGIYTWPNPCTPKPPYTACPTSHQGHIDELKTWIQGRAEWIDANINDL